MKNADGRPLHAKHFLNSHGESGKLTMGRDQNPLTLEHANSLLKQAGLRRTVARIKLLQCLAEQSSPRTQAEIEDCVAANGFDTSTIFRALNDLAETALVVRLDAGDRIRRFELHDRNRDGSRAAHHHPHIVCQHCGTMICLEQSVMDQLRPAFDDWLVDNLTIRGRCPDCRALRRATPD